jgi:hypothetical protein
MDYKPQIRLRAVQKNPKKKPGADINVTNVSPVLEVSKYVAKSNQYIASSHMKQSQNRTNEAVKCLAEAIKGRRVVAYGGEMKRIHKLLNLAEKNKDKNEEIREDIAEIARLFKWDFTLRNYEEF